MRLVAGEDGYPPHQFESLWARRSADNYVVDSIPFFTDEVAPSDVVELAADSDGQLWFVRVAKRGGHSVVRVVSEEDEVLFSTRSELRALGCEVETAIDFGARAVDVGPAVDYSLVVGLLDDRELSGTLQWGEGATADDT